MYLLDTNIVSALRLPHKQPPELRAWAASIPFEQCFISVITMLEIEIGILRLERREPASAKLLRQWVEGEVKPTFGDHVLPVDTAVAMACAPFHVPNPSSERDALIAATAIVHGLQVVTRNVRHFQHLPVRVIDPWQSEPSRA